MIMKLTKRCSQ